MKKWKRKYKELKEENDRLEILYDDLQERYKKEITSNARLAIELVDLKKNYDKSDIITEEQDIVRDNPKVIDYYNNPFFNEDKTPKINSFDILENPMFKYYWMIQDTSYYTHQIQYTLANHNLENNTMIIFMQRLEVQQAQKNLAEYLSHKQ